MKGPAAQELIKFKPYPCWRKNATALSTSLRAANDVKVFNAFLKVVTKARALN